MEICDIEKWRKTTKNCVLYASSRVYFVQSDKSIGLEEQAHGEKIPSNNRKIVVVYLFSDIYE